jgi:DNA-binding CsgD family transcriptional regulator
MAGLTLSEADVRALRAVIEFCRHDSHEAAVPWSALYLLREMLHADWVEFAGLDPAATTAYVCQEIGDGNEDEWVEFETEETQDRPFWWYFWETECAAYPELTGDFDTKTPEDFYTGLGWRSLPMYADLARPAGIDRYLVAVTSDGPGRTLKIICKRRPGRAFGEREKFLLTLVSPHVVESYRRSQTTRSGAANTLTPRQRELLHLVSAGWTNAQIARRTNLSEATVRTHLANIYSRLGVRSRTAAVTRGLGSPAGLAR